ncbi:hypothetical protein Tco_0597502 [Tanacetum coccineum]
MTTLDIPHGLHRGRHFLKYFGGPSNDPILLLMEIPHMLHLEGKFFESCGCLLLVCRDDIGSTKFTIYKMMKGSFVWSVRYLVNIEQLMNPLPERWSIRTSVWSIYLGEGENDAFVVINLSGKVVKYNLISKTNTEIFDIGSNQMDDDDAVVFIPPFEVDLRVDPNLYESFRHHGLIGIHVVVSMVVLHLVQPVSTSSGGMIHQCVKEVLALHLQTTSAEEETQREAQQANKLSNLTRQRQLLASVNYRLAIIEELERLLGNLVACKTTEHLKRIQNAVFIEVIDLKKKLRLQVPP